MATKVWARGATLLVVLALVGCRSAPVQTQGQPAPQQVTLYVTNNHPLDVRIAALQRGRSMTVGVAPAFLTIALDLPSAAIDIGTVRLRLDPIGSSDWFMLPPIGVLPGEDLELRIEQYLPFSTIRTR